MLPVAVNSGASPLGFTSQSKHKGKIMLNFLIHGILANIYAMIIIWIIARAITPKSGSLSDKKLPLALKVALTLVPYLLAILSFFLLMSFIHFRFDYEKIKEAIEKRNEQ